MRSSFSKLHELDANRAIRNTKKSKHRMINEMALIYRSLAFIYKSLAVEIVLNQNPNCGKIFPDLTHMIMLGKNNAFTS